MIIASELLYCWSHHFCDRGCALSWDLPCEAPKGRLMRSSAGTCVCSMTVDQMGPIPCTGVRWAQYPQQHRIPSFAAFHHHFKVEFLPNPWVFLLEHIWVSFCPQLDVGSVLDLSRFSWEQLRAGAGPGKPLQVRTCTNLLCCVSRRDIKDSNHRAALTSLVETNTFYSSTNPLLFM